MSENKAIIIKDKVEIPKLRLWLIWLLLFVFPAITTIIGFNFLSKEYRYFVNTDLIYEGFDNIKKYNQLIIPENYIEEQQTRIKDLDTSLAPEILKEKIDNILLGETSYCIFFDEKVKNANIVKSSNAKKISLILFTKYFNELIQNYTSKDKDDSKESDFENSQTQLANFIQTVFNTVTPVTISINQTSKNFSVIQGGELYFIFTKFDNPNKDCSWCFAVLKGNDFSYEKMLKNLHEQFPEIKIVFREFPLNKTVSEKEVPLSYCGIKHNKNELYILAPADLKFTRHVIFNGSFEIDKKYENLFPFIKYHISLEKTEEYINSIIEKIKYVALVVIVISAIYFLYISLFNFDKNLSFKGKIILLTLVSSLFPFSVFSFGVYSFEKYNRFILETSIQHQAEFELNFVAKELEHYLMNIEAKLSDFAQTLSKELKNSDIKASTVLEIFNNMGKLIPLSKESLYLKAIPKNLEILTSNNQITKSFPDRLSKEFFEEMLTDEIDSIPSTILPYLNEDYPKEREAKDYVEIGGKKIISYDIGRSLVYNDKLILFDKYNGSSWVNTQQLYNSSNNKVIGFLITKFEPRPILGFFLSQSNLAKNGFQEKKYNYVINYAFLPIEKSGTATIWDGSGLVSPDIKKLCLKNPITGEFNLDNKKIITKINQRVPYLSIATITELQPYSENIFILNIILSIILYLALILLLASNLLDFIFVEPVMLLATNAIAIANGGEEWYTKIKSGDEFEELNNSFINLVTGLRERNILKSYVSEDAFSDIEESESLKLLPGGEYIEATIVFSALKDYDKLSKEITPQESIELLSKFLSIAEEVTKKYNGSIDKIIGDTIMLVFRNNPNLSSHAIRAAEASLKLVEKAKMVDLPKLYTGIASGRVISGKIGSRTGKLDFTVIGNPVNSAARFKVESKNGTEQTGIIISGTTIGLARGRAKVKFLRRVAIKGKSRMYNIYELVGIRE